jgi:hypothetical protein
MFPEYSPNIPEMLQTPGGKASGQLESQDYKYRPLPGHKHAMLRASGHKVENSQRVKSTQA